MTINVTTPVTGSAQTGFTTPGYTIIADSAPSVFGRQYAVSALTGTQAGVTIHSASSPFTITAYRPANFKQLGKANPVSGVIANVPKNQWKFIFRKGVVPLAGQPYQIAQGTILLDIPAGSDTADPANLRALMSVMIGTLTQVSAGAGDSLVQGVL